MRLCVFPTSIDGIRRLPNRARVSRQVARRGAPSEREGAGETRAVSVLRSDVSLARVGGRVLAGSVVH